MDKICPNCYEKCREIKTFITHGQLVTGCELCSHTLVQGNELAAQSKRAFDRRDRRKSNIQPVEVEEYIAAYPEQARELYGDDTVRKYGH